MTSALERYRRSSAGYPITGVYLAGVALAILVAAGKVQIEVGIIGLTLVGIAALVIAVMREVRVIHTLVNSQRDELLNRITDLVNALHDAGVSVPNQRSGHNESVARSE